jgi:hypothetical protein
MKMSHPSITDRKLPDRVVRDRYGVCSRTLARWDNNPELNFPKPTIINGRKYRSEDELASWDRLRAAQHSISNKRQQLTGENSSSKEATDDGCRSQPNPIGNPAIGDPAASAVRPGPTDTPDEIIPRAKQ